MGQRDMLRRYLDAGIAFTEMTRARAEGIAGELVKAGELQRDQLQTSVDELIDRSRRNTDRLISLVRREVSSQLGLLGLATKADLEDLEKRLTKKFAGQAAAAKKAAANTSAAVTKSSTGTKKATSKKAAEKKVPAKNSSAS